MSDTAAFAPGGIAPRYDRGQITALLADHARLVQRLAPQQREASIVLRRDDVVALADLLGETTGEVIEKLGALIGATIDQRATMAKLFAAGALVIGLATTGAVFARGADVSGSIAPARLPAASAPVVEVIEQPTLSPEIDLGLVLAESAVVAPSPVDVAAPVVDEVIAEPFLIVDPPLLPRPTPPGP